MKNSVYHYPEVLSSQAPLVSFTKSDVHCYGEHTGSIHLTATGVGTLIYFWFDNNSASEDRIGLAAGTYRVLIRDDNGSTLENITIIQPDILNASVNYTNGSCTGPGGGTITITNPVGGNGTYEFSIDGGSSWKSSRTFTNLPNNTYNVQIHDAGCPDYVVTLNNALVISQPSLLSITGNLTACVMTTLSTITDAVSPTYIWYKDNLEITDQTASTLVATASGDYKVKVTDSSTSCQQTSAASTVAINPTPNASATPSNQAICSASNISTIELNSNLTGTTYNWTRDNTGTVTGIAENESGNVSGTLTNTTDSPINVTFTITPTDNGCPGNSITATVVVNPTPDVVATPSTQIICSARNITNIVLIGNVTGTTCNWTRDNTGTVTGIAESGSGDISGTLTNTTNSPITVTFTITPTTNGCPGNPITADVLVNPTPTTSATPANQTICSASNITAILLNSNLTGTNYNWTRDNTVTATGIAASGSGNINGKLTNTTNSPITVTFTITPTSNGCTGNPTSAVVIINPIPVLSSPLSENICGSTLFNYTPTSNTPGTTFSWTRTAVLGIQNVASSGTGAVNETLINATGTPKTATYVYTLNVNGCINIQNVVITVLPLPTLLSSVSPPSVCSNNPFNYVPVGSIPGTIMTWERTVIPGISNPAGAGTGNINETLINTTAIDVVVSYVYTLSLQGCINTATIHLTIKPTPVLSGTLNPAPICSNTVFSYQPQSLTTGTTFNWSRIPVAGISNGPAS